jgi:hypothetical protein
LAHKMIFRVRSWIGRFQWDVVRVLAIILQCTTSYTLVG